jgi:hypothetical protein
MSRHAIFGDTQEKHLDATTTTAEHKLVSLHCPRQPRGESDRSFADSRVTRPARRSTTLDRDDGHSAAAGGAQRCHTGATPLSRPA